MATTSVSTKVVSIEINVEGGVITYGPDNSQWSVKVHRGDEVEWVCGGRALTIAFLGPCPFDLKLHAGVGKTRAARVRDNALTSAYKYSVVVHNGFGKPPLKDDPEICIDG